MQAGRNFVAASLALLAGLAGLTTAAPAAEPAPPMPTPRALPFDVVLVTIDTLRRDHLPIYGYPLDTAPNLSALAHSSVVFDNAVAASVRTAPSHASMLTGLTPFGHGVLNNKGRLNDGVPTLAGILRGRGCRTGGFVSSVTLSRRTGLERGFEAYDDEVGATQERSAPATLARAREWLSGIRTSEPVFLFVHFFEPHYPYSPPADCGRLFLPPGATTEPSPDFPQLHAMRARGFTRPEIEVLKARYDGEIRAADAAVGELLRLLEARGTLDSTLLVVVADHGETLDDRVWMFDHGAQLYEEQARVPLLVRLPAAAHGGDRVAAAVTHVDLLPTVLELLGVTTDHLSVGTSLLAALRGDPDLAHRALVTLGSSEARQVPHLRPAPLEGGLAAAVRLGALKLVVYPTAEGEVSELFDLDHDPREQVAVNGSRLADVHRLRRRLDSWLGGRPDLLRSITGPLLPPADEGALRSLGYVE
jgi:arylsulfatase A-like enzyme